MTTPASAEAVRHLYLDHHGWLTTWLRRQLGCSQRAADLAQDTFLRVLLREGEPCALREPRAYLRTIAKGLMIDQWRRRRLEQAYLDALAEHSEFAVSPEHQALVLETLLQVERLLAELPPRVRQAFLLSQLHGMTYAAIGERLGVSERMVKKYMSRAMLACLTLLEDDT